MVIYKTLSIAGFDGSGGAGIQADLKTFSALGCYGMTVLTALPVQNTCGVRQCYPIPLAAVEEQLEAIFEDIPPDAIKIGMLFTEDIIEVVASFLAKHAANIPIVLDPVVVAKSGAALLLPEAIATLKTRLLPHVTLLTPNLPEAQTLTGIPITSEKDMHASASSLLELGVHNVLLKGGHLPQDRCNDLLLRASGESHWFSSARVDSKNTHGTGCTLSAAITALLAQNVHLPKACSMAKEYLFQAINAARAYSIGLGHGPVHHFHQWWPVSLSALSTDKE